jgi:hypothetical protein
MDKWKDAELEKMRAGGNRLAKEFLSSQPDWQVQFRPIQIIFCSVADPHW